MENGQWETWRQEVCRWMQFRHGETPQSDALKPLYQEGMTPIAAANHLGQHLERIDARVF